MPNNDGLKKEGNWDLVGLLTSNLSREIEASKQFGLKRVGLHMEKTAKKHMSRQDLGWAPLAPSTIAHKIRENLSDKVLIATSTYFQSITSYVKNDTALAGVRRKVRTAEGQEMADIAKIHETGKNKRPLWAPTFKESIRWFALKQPHIVDLKERLKKYGV